jgi:transcriptional regulator with XRE-family HTH domain
MVMTSGSPYSGEMPDLGVVLAANLRRVRKKHAGTQERFSEMVGFSQPRLSELERGKGWEQIRGLGERLEEAGINPLELLNLELDEEQAELVELYNAADPRTKEAIRHLLRSSAAAADQKQIARR